MVAKKKIESSVKNAPRALAFQIGAAMSLTNSDSISKIEQIERDIFSVLKDPSLNSNSKKKLGERIGQNLAPLIVRFAMAPSSGPGKFSNAKKGIFSSEGVMKNWKKVWIDSGFLSYIIGKDYSSIISYALSNQGRQTLKRAGYALNIAKTGYGAVTAPVSTGFKTGARAATALGFPKSSEFLRTSGVAATTYVTPGLGSAAGLVYKGYNFLPPNTKAQLAQYTYNKYNRFKHATGEELRKQVIKNMNNNKTNNNRSKFFTEKYPELRNAKKWFDAANSRLGNHLIINASTAANAIFNRGYKNKNGRLVSYSNYNWNKYFNTTGLTNKDRQVIKALGNKKVTKNARNTYWSEKTIGV